MTLLIGKSKNINTTDPHYYDKYSLLHFFGEQVQASFYANETENKRLS